MVALIRWRQNRICKEVNANLNNMMGSTANLQAQMARLLHNNDNVGVGASQPMPAVRLGDDLSNANNNGGGEETQRTLQKLNILNGSDWLPLMSNLFLTTSEHCFKLHIVVDEANEVLEGVVEVYTMLPTSKMTTTSPTTTVSTLFSMVETTIMAASGKVQWASSNCPNRFSREVHIQISILIGRPRLSATSVSTTTRSHIKLR